MVQEPEKDITLSIFLMAGGGFRKIQNLHFHHLIGRIQHVNYHTNDLEGYVAEVTYEGHHGAVGGHGGHLGHGGHGGIGGHGVHGGHP